MSSGDAGVEPLYLNAEDVLHLYGAIVGCTAEQASDHLRDHSGLESAMKRPATHAHYEDADLALQAAVLAHGLAEGQLFIDGNKRIALVAMLTFLEVNDVNVDATDPQLADWILSLSAGAAPEQLAEQIRASTHR
jgi:death-on-curing protein